VLKEGKITFENFINITGNCYDKNKNMKESTKVPGCVVPVNSTLHTLHGRLNLHGKRWYRVQIVGMSQVVINYPQSRVIPVYKGIGPE
jgi:hypothetical protein